MASSCSSLFHPAHLTGPCRQSPFTTTTARSSISLERQNSSLARSRLFFPTPSTSGPQIQATLSNRRLSFTPSAAIHGELSADVRLGAWIVAADIDPATAKLAIGVLGPFLPAFAFLFIVRIVMSWYPKLPVGKFPYVVAYAPTEPILAVTRKVIPPLAGVDVTPVVWFGLVSFLNEILVGPQGLLVLISQQVN